MHLLLPIDAPFEEADDEDEGDEEYSAAQVAAGADECDRHGEMLPIDAPFEEADDEDEGDEEYSAAQVAAGADECDRHDEMLVHRSLVAILKDVQEVESKLEAEESPEPPPSAPGRSPSKAWTSPRVALMLTDLWSCVNSLGGSKLKSTINTAM